ncbi:MAG: LAGLIDADG family homing endonuclease [bacterium]
MQYKKSAEVVVSSPSLKQTGAGKGPNHENNNLHPEYIVGFVDGEGCFCISISKHQTLKRRQEVRAEFEIELRADDEEILNQIKNAFGCGNIYRLNYARYKWHPHVKYKVSNINDLSEKIIPFFNRYKLRAKKRLVYELFCEAVMLIKSKQHLTDVGFKKIVSLRNKIRKLNNIRGTARVR